MNQRILTPLEASTIQTALNGHGATLIVDGNFGELSRQALIRFQSERGIPDTGSPDIETINALGIPDIFTPPQPKRTPIVTNILGSIFTGLFANLLNWQLVQGYIRSALMTVGGWIGLDGLVGSDGSKAIIGAIMVIIGVIFQAISNNTKKKALDVVKAADAAPDVNVIPASATSSGKPIVHAMK